MKSLTQIVMYTVIYDLFQLKNVSDGIALKLTSTHYVLLPQPNVTVIN